MFTGETGDITATFDLSQLAPLLRDTDQFTQQDGWKLVTIPESSSAMLSLVRFLATTVLLRSRLLS